VVAPTTWTPEEWRRWLTGDVVFAVIDGVLTPRPRADGEQRQTTQQRAALLEQATRARAAQPIAASSPSKESTMTIKSYNDGTVVNRDERGNITSTTSVTPPLRPGLVRQDGELLYHGHPVRINAVGKATVQIPNGWEEVAAFEAAGGTADDLGAAVPEGLSLLTPTQRAELEQRGAQR